MEKCYLCNICTKSFSTEFLVKQHTVQKHLFNLNPQFITDTNGVKQRSLTDEKPFSCKLCGKRFKFRLGLKKHEITHSSPEENVEDNHNEREREPSFVNKEPDLNQTDLGDIDLVIERNDYGESPDISEITHNRNSIENIDTSKVLKIKSEIDSWNNNDKNLMLDIRSSTKIEIIDSDSEPEDTGNELKLNVQSDVCRTSVNNSGTSSNLYFSPTNSLKKRVVENDSRIKTSPRSNLSLKLQKSKCAVYYIDSDEASPNNRLNLNSFSPSSSIREKILHTSQFTGRDNHETTAEENCDSVTNSTSLISLNSVEERPQISKIPSSSSSSELKPEPTISPIYILDPTGNYLECPHCSQRYKSIEELQYHDTKFHQLITCDICGVQNKGEYRLKQHYIKHRKDKTYFCGLCCKAFKTKGHLKTHLLIHSDIFPYTCNLCYREFRRKNELKIHQDADHNCLVHVCEKCGKGFKTKYILKYHKIKCEDTDNDGEDEEPSHEHVHNSLRRSGVTKDNSDKVTKILDQYKIHLHNSDERTPFV